eukprot:9175056-Alexandrium_andersonii.AAC.1
MELSPALGARRQSLLLQLTSPRPVVRRVPPAIRRLRASRPAPSRALPSLVALAPRARLVHRLPHRAP